MYKIILFISLTFLVYISSAFDNAVAHHWSTHTTEDQGFFTYEAAREACDTRAGYRCDSYRWEKGPCETTRRFLYTFHNQTEFTYNYCTASTGCPDGYTNMGGICHPSEYSNPDKRLGAPSVCTSSQINIATANNFYRELDFENRSNPQLNLIRYYNSVADDNLTQFGAKWRSNHDVRLQFLKISTVEQIKAVRQDGRIITFFNTGNGWFGDANVREELSEIKDENGTRTGFKLLTENNSTETYSNEGLIEKIISLYGVETKYSYLDGRLHTVSSEIGGSVMFSYGNNGSVNHVTNADGSVISYEYDSNHNLSTANYPGGTTANPQNQLYHYEDNRIPDALTGITDPNNKRIFTWSYNDAGQVIKSEGPGGERSMIVTYNADGSSTVTNPLGKQTTYFFDTVYGAQRVTMIKGHESSQCASSNSSYTYDQNGFRDQITDWQGHVTDYDYDARGLEVRRVEGFNTAEERLIQTEWRPTLRLPVKVTTPQSVTVYQYDADGRLISKTVSPNPQGS